jgi:hypothetical protein
MSDQQQILLRVTKKGNILLPDNKSYRTGHSTNKHKKNGSEDT